MTDLLFRLCVFFLCCVLAAVGLALWAMGSFRDDSGMLLFAGLGGLLVLAVGTFVQIVKGPPGG
jgi:hypothetical protein